jgi:hypothetical protein
MEHSETIDTAMHNKLILTPDSIPVLSKQNAKTFYQIAKERIFETGNGLFEMLETLKFCADVYKQITGDSASKIEPDEQMIDYVREQIRLNADKNEFTTARGVKFSIAETGTSYSFENCGDTILAELEEKAKQAAENVKARKEFLKAIPKEGIEFRNGDELVKVFQPIKTSKSSFKIQLPK